MGLWIFQQKKTIQKEKKQTWPCAGFAIDHYFSMAFSTVKDIKDIIFHHFTPVSKQGDGCNQVINKFVVTSLEIRPNPNIYTSVYVT